MQPYIQILFDNLTAVVMKSINFWDITPCSPLSFSLLACCFLADLISSILKMEAICSSETSVESQWTKRRYIPEVDTVQKLNLVAGKRRLTIFCYV
jgi:hypothetical protein